MKRVLINKVKESKYYGMLFVETPDRARREQMSRGLHYVHIDWENKTAEIKESFLEVLGKDSESIAEAITTCLENDRIPLENCRSQCYDNAAVMSGHVSGVQKRILDQNSKTIYTNCDNHSLNFCGVHASHVEPELATFFCRC